MAKNDPNGRTALYRLLAVNGRLLYVGIAANPDSRWGGHSTNQPWWNDVADRKVEWFPNRAAAAAAEVAAIKAERPLHNIQHAVVDKPAIPEQSIRDRLPFRRSEERPPPPVAFLPNDLESEQRLLGSMLRSKRAIRDSVAIVDINDFFRPAHSIIWFAAFRLDEDGSSVDPITLGSYLTETATARWGNVAYLHELHGTVASGSNAGHYAAIVHALAVTRRAMEEQWAAKN